MVMQGSSDLDFSDFVNGLRLLLMTNSQQGMENLIYLKAKDPNEFWSPLLEKAYAKLYGSYTALEGGLTIDAYVDFTGGIPENIDLSNLGIKKERLFKILVKAYENKAFMSCSLSNSDSQAAGIRLGLQARHAYTITKVVEVPSTRHRGRNTVSLIRIRNPHGNSNEWKGAWSDQDVEWRNLKDSVKKELGLTFDDDGEFYMDFNLDFLRYFGKVEIVHKTPAGMMEQQSSIRKYEVISFQGAWTEETAGGFGNDTIKNFMKNPQYMFSLTDPDPDDDEMTCPVIISLAQKVKKRKTEHAIGFRIYQVPPGLSRIDVDYVSRNQPMGTTDKYINLREVSKRFKFPPGNYCVIPTTFSSGDEGEFLLRTFVEKYWGNSKQGAKQSFKEGGVMREGGYKPGSRPNLSPAGAAGTPEGSVGCFPGGDVKAGNEVIPDICYNCKAGIKGRSSVKLETSSGQVLMWHEDCLQCSACRRGISMDNVVFKDKLFCKSCYTDTMLNKCDKCEKPITGVGITFSGKFWHDTCFACDQCDDVFQEGKFINLRDQKLCDSCYRASTHPDLTNINRLSWRRLATRKEEVLR